MRQGSPAFQPVVFGLPAPRACLIIDLVTGRGELTDAAWERIGPLLPGSDGCGRPWRDHRQVINGVLWRLRTGAPWRDLPERYGPWQTVYERFARWDADGTWAKLLEQVQVRDDAVGTMEWTVSVDSTINRAHQHAAGARKGEANGDKLENPERSAERQALGRSRGGLTTKVHLAVDGHGLPLSLVLAPGNTNDSTLLRRHWTPSASPDPGGDGRAPAGSGPRRQGVFVPGNPRLVQASWHRRYDP